MRMKLGVLPIYCLRIKTKKKERFLKHCQQNMIKIKKLYFKNLES